MPGYSECEADIRAMSEYFKNYQMIQKVEVLPYHTLGAHKYESLEQTYHLQGVKENTPEQLEAAEKLFKEYFLNVQIN